MSSDHDEIFARNRDREHQQRGERHVCDECGKAGVIGEDLWAGYSTRDGSEWWIHESCAPARGIELPPPEGGT